MALLIGDGQSCIVDSQNQNRNHINPDESADGPLFPVDVAGNESIMSVTHFVPVRRKENWFPCLCLPW